MKGVDRWLDGGGLGGLDRRVCGEEFGSWLVAPSSIRENVQHGH